MNRFREMVSILRAALPPILPVRVYLRRSVESGAYGACWLVHGSDGRPSHFTIAIRKSSWAVVRDSLLHEWAHAIAWSEAHDVIDDHGPEWGLAMSRVYQAAIAL